MAEKGNYTILTGDSLSKIALCELGDIGLWVELAKANNIENPNRIYAGNTLDTTASGVANKYYNLPSDIYADDYALLINDRIGKVMDLQNRILTNQNKKLEQLKKEKLKQVTSKGTESVPKPVSGSNSASGGGRGTKPTKNLVNIPESKFDEKEESILLYNPTIRSSDWIDDISYKIPFTGKTEDSSSFKAGIIIPVYNEGKPKIRYKYPDVDTEAYDYYEDKTREAHAKSNAIAKQSSKEYNSLVDKAANAISKKIKNTGVSTPVTNVAIGDILRFKSGDYGYITGMNKTKDGKVQFTYIRFTKKGNNSKYQDKHEYNDLIYDKNKAIYVIR